jgi:5'(3')-deoxyribonucleotidase
MRIGVDVDGVLADFNTSFIERVIQVTGKDLFPPRPFDIPVWDYPQSYGYTDKETHAVWENIKADPTFWYGLSPYPDTLDALHLFRDMANHHDIYFITARPGIVAKQQTERWLRALGGDPSWGPTVLISSDKLGCVKALNIELYIDDKTENIQSTSLACMSLLLTRPWNAKAKGLTRVATLMDFFNFIRDYFHARAAASVV